MPDPIKTDGPMVPMLELAAVRWLLAELAAGRMSLADADDYAIRTAGPARAVLDVPVSSPAQLPGEEPFPLPAVVQ